MRERFTNLENNIKENMTKLETTEQINEIAENIKKGYKYLIYQSTNSPECRLDIAYKVDVKREASINLITNDSQVSGVLIGLNCADYFLKLSKD